jgi:hypothetical protein
VVELHWLHGIHVLDPSLICFEIMSMKEPVLQVTS